VSTFAFNDSRKRLSTLIMMCLATASYVSDANAEDASYAADDEQEKDRSFLCLAEQAIYHSNLFHLNRTTTDVEQRLGPGASRYNTALRTTACVEGHWQKEPQEFLLRAAIDDNRYLDNKILNHTSGNAELTWNWQTAGNWHGQLGGDYQRALGTFVNDRPLVKDIVQSYRYFAEVNHDFGAHIIARVRGSRTDTSHDAEERRVDNYRSTTGVAELILMSRAENYLGFGVQRVEAVYPFPVVIGDVTFDRDYREDSASARFHYELAGKTSFEGAVGYLKHEYKHDPSTNYQGEVWRAALNWQPRENIQFVIAGWKNLASYFDSEADHFISRGASLTPKWTPDDKWTISMPLRWERQQYIFRSVLTATLEPREDKVKIAGIDINFRPRNSLYIDLNYSYEQRDSSLPLYGYTDEMTALQIQWRF